MSTIQFEDELEALLKKIYKDTQVNLSLDQLLHIIFEFGKENYELILKKVIEQQNEQVKRKKFIENFAGIIDVEDDGVNPKEIWNRKDI